MSENSQQKITLMAFLQDEKLGNAYLTFFRNLSFIGVMFIFGIKTLSLLVIPSFSLKFDDIFLTLLVFSSISLAIFAFVINVHQFLNSYLVAVVNGAEAEFKAKNLKGFREVFNVLRKHNAFSTFLFSFVITFVGMFFLIYTTVEYLNKF